MVKLPMMLCKDFLCFGHRTVHVDVTTGAPGGLLLGGILALYIVERECAGLIQSGMRTLGTVFYSCTAGASHRPGVETLALVSEKLVVTRLTSLRPENKHSVYPWFSLTR